MSMELLIWPMSLYRGAMADSSDRAPGYLNTYGATSDPWKLVYLKRLLNADLYAASCHTFLASDALVTSFAVLHVESTNNQFCGTITVDVIFLQSGFFHRFIVQVMR